MCSPAPRLKAPSINVLKFLRAQNDGRPFFTFNSGLQRCLHQRRFDLCTYSARRSMTASVPPIEALESSLPVFELLKLGHSKVQNSRACLGLRRSSAPSLFQTPPASIAKPGTRYVSSAMHSENKRGLKRLWPWGKKSGGEDQQNDVPLSPFLDDDANLGKRMRTANEMRLRCTEFDENGNITLVNGEFKKSVLIAKV